MGRQVKCAHAVMQDNVGIVKASLRGAVIDAVLAAYDKTKEMGKG